MDIVEILLNPPSMYDVQNNENKLYMLYNMIEDAVGEIQNLREANREIQDKIYWTAYAYKISEEGRQRALKAFEEEDKKSKALISAMSEELLSLRGSFPSEAHQHLYDNKSKE